MVRVDVEVAGGLDGQVEARVPGEAVEQVVQEANTAAISAAPVPSTSSERSTVVSRVSRWSWAMRCGSLGTTRRTPPKAERCWPRVSASMRPWAGLVVAREPPDRILRKLRYGAGDASPAARTARKGSAVEGNALLWVLVACVGLAVGLGLALARPRRPSSERTDLLAEAHAAHDELLRARAARGPGRALEAEGAARQALSVIEETERRLSAAKSAFEPGRRPGGP